MGKGYKNVKKSKKKLARKIEKCYTHIQNPKIHFSFLLLIPFYMLTRLDVKKSSTNTGIKIFIFDGELDETNVDTTFPSIIADIGDFNSAKILFNLEKLEYLNSKSIGYIADVAQRTEDGKGKFALCSLSHDVGDTLELVGITSIIPVYEDEQTALIELSK